VLVATTEFRDAAAAQARSLGFEPAVVWVDHPIQNRTPEELEALADESIEHILRAITSDSGVSEDFDRR
jgi:hypothetical protein